MNVRDFIDRHYKHFNACTLKDAAEAYARVIDDGAHMMVTLAGAMSTAELGRSLAEMIRQGKVHAITCTGANLEEDLFKLIAYDLYERIPHYRDLTPDDEARLLAAGRPRVTDTCIPEEEAMRVLEAAVIPLWQQADAAGESRFPHQYLYEIIRAGTLAGSYQDDPADSWLVAAAERDLPMFVPGWEDSTLGNMFAAKILSGDIASSRAVKPGVDAMVELARWYRAQSANKRSPGFFQIGGGIAGDFPICVVPMLRYDIKEATPSWSYFCQISDSTTSYGSYSGAEPNEKITWGKLDPDTPRFIIESDATIVTPLIFAHILGW